MAVDFVKMNGAGNDFVLIDNRSRRVKLQPAQIAHLCDRHKGVGADGVILLEPCPSGQADWAWDFYNSDGSSAEMCGNGARCFAHFVRRLTGTKGPLSFATRAGVITARFQGDDVTIDLTLHSGQAGRTEVPRFQGDTVTVNLTPPKDLRLRQQVPLSGGPAEIHSLNTGVPHAVLFVPDADKAMVQPLGAEIRHHPHFGPKGTNVNFVQVLGPGQIRVRTFERGVEGETLACGTGVTASALITAELRGFPSPIQVQVQSGDRLEISFDRTNGTFSQVGLTGPAEFVFEGRIEV
jgi:diaminopimelate epimerase